MGDESLGAVCAILTFSADYKFFIIIKLFIKKRQEREDKRKRKASKSRKMDEDKE